MIQSSGQKSIQVYRMFRDPEKHYVRRMGWVEYSKKRLQTLNEQERPYGLRYFTLCGAEAIDVILMKKEGLIKDDGRGFPSVYYLESHYHSFASAKSLLGRTRGMNKSFEDAVSIPRIKSLIHEQPFDVIKLDFSGCCFPRSDQPFSSTLRALVEMITLQCGNAFDLFVTFKASKTEDNAGAVKELIENMCNNFVRYLDLEQLFRRQYANRSPEELLNQDYGRFLLATFPKIVIGFGTRKGYNVNSNVKYVYKRRHTGERQYQMVKFIFTFENRSHSEGFGVQSRPDPEEPVAYRKAVYQDLNNIPVDVDEELARNKPLRASLDTDLKQVIDMSIPFGV
ncbi:hypothetical protein MUP77_23135 [Candidatus Bathyarchaeota archaeon]|nr:hypothetical protein [Candidatus Bathyarchaeota archaeon]